MANTYHPSNILYRGECHDFREAMDLVVAECDIEASWSLAHLGTGDATEDAKLIATWTAYKAAAQEARRIYDRHTEVATAVAEMRASGNEDLQHIADALESGDYSSLAV